MVERGPLRIGELYAVPQIRARITQGTRARWIPIRGPGHNDRTFFDFSHWHWHLDHRFLDEATFEALSESAERNHTQTETLVLIARQIRPTPIPDTPRRDRKLRYYRDPVEGDLIPHTQGFAPDAVPTETWQRVKEMMCMRDDPPVHQHTDSAANAMQSHYAQRPWPDTTRCPHRGVSLAHLHPDSNGFVQCPLHGLMLCPRTRTIPSPETVRETIATQPPQ